MDLKTSLFLIIHVIVGVLADTFPSIQFETLLPQGLRIAIPHEAGISQVTFHVNINRPIAANEAGDFSGVVTEPTNGRWILENTSAMIYYSSKIGYWIIVRYGAKSVEKIATTIVSGAFMVISDADQVTPMNLKLPSGCDRSVTTVKGNPVCTGELIFEDNFDELDWTKWNREIRIPLESDDAGFVSYQRRSENFYVNDGQLHIVPSLLIDVPGFDGQSIYKDKLDLEQYCTAIVDMSQACSKVAMFSQILPPIVSARARTRHAFSFRYGKVEVRAKVPKGDWLLPLILLEPLENYYGFSGYASGQMRVASIRGNEFLEDINGADISGKMVSGGAILTVGEQLRDTWMKGTLERSHLGNDFHIYTLTWSEDSISLEIDGNRYSVIQGGFARRLRTSKSYAKHWENGHYMAPFDREFYLTVGLSVGGHSDFPDGSRSGSDLADKPWENNSPKAASKFWSDRDRWLQTWVGDNAGLHIDYIRVYAL